MRLLACVAAACGCLFAQQQIELPDSVSVCPAGYFGGAPAAPDKPAPLLIALSPGLEQAAAKSAYSWWQNAVAGRGWTVVAPYARCTIVPADALVVMLDRLLKDVRQRYAVDPARVYLSSTGTAVSLGFYIASRAPDRIAASVAIGGTPRDAIRTNRLFGANTGLDPVLWLIDPATESAVDLFRKRLKEAGYNVLVRATTEFRTEDILDWLSGHQWEDYPRKVGCETGNLDFASCYWLRITRYNAAARNDALPSTRVAAGSGASLGLGAFGFRASAPGPGVLVESLPDGYKGPLKLQDRIVAVAGYPVEDAAAFVDLMEEFYEQKTTGVIIQRGKERLRLETKIIVPEREEILTAGAQAEYVADTGEIVVITRQVGELQLNLPQYWLPARLNWNGTAVGEAVTPGCWVLSLGANARQCPQ
jgi:hypothetical protein